MGRELEPMNMTTEQRNEVIALLKRYLPDTEAMAQEKINARPEDAS